MFFFFPPQTAVEMDAYRKCLSHANKSLVLSDNYFKCDQKCFQSLPKSIDWRDKNLVTPVKDQVSMFKCL